MPGQNVIHSSISNRGIGVSGQGSIPNMDKKVQIGSKGSNCSISVSGSGSGSGSGSKGQKGEKGSGSSDSAGSTRLHVGSKG